MTTLQQFTYEPARNVRAILNDRGEPIFVASDVCKVLDIRNVSQAMERLDEDQKLIYATHISGQTRDIWCVTESGLYELIFASSKPEAKQFRKWVTSNLLPTLRKTGKIELTDKTIRRNMIPAVQIQNAKQVNNYNYQRGGVESVKYHNIEIEKALTNKTPKEWREYGKKKGLPSKIYNSGKAVIRHEMPAEACSISTADDLVKQGYSMEQAIRVAKLLRDGFNEMIKIGYVPHELNM